MKASEIIKELTDAEIAKLRKDAEASLKASIDKQSDARIAKAQQDAKPKSFMSQVGDKIIGGVKGAAKGFAGGTNAVKEDASAGGMSSASVAAVVAPLGATKKKAKKQESYSNVIRRGGTVKASK